MMANLPDPFSDVDVTTELASDMRLSPVERVIERSTFHFDVAHCIKWTFVGIAVLIIAWSGTGDQLVATLRTVLRVL